MFTMWTKSLEQRRTVLSLAIRLIVFSALHRLIDKVLDDTKMEGTVERKLTVHMEYPKGPSRSRGFFKVMQPDLSIPMRGCWSSFTIKYAIC